MAVQTLFGKVQGFDRAEFQRAMKRPRFLAPILHVILFAVMVLAASKPGAFDIRGPVAGSTFFALLLLDFPISVVAFSMMWGAAEADISSSAAPYLISWCVFATLWWFLLGISIEAWIRRFRRKPEASE